MTENIEKKKVLLAANVELEIINKIDKLAEKTNRSRSGMLITILEEWLSEKEG